MVEPRHPPDGRRARARHPLPDRDRAGRDAGAGARRAARRPRVHARALPAVLRVRLARGLCRHPLGRAGVHRLRGDRQDGARAATGGPRRRDRAGARAGDRRRPRPAPARWSAPRAPSGCSPRSRCGCARRPAPASTRGCSSPASPRAWRPSGGSRASTSRCPTWCACPTSARPQLSLMLAEQGPLKGALTRAYMGVRGVAGGCLAILGFEGSEYEVAARRGTGEGAAAPPRRQARGELPGARLAAGALRRALPARRPARPGGDGRDARDGRPVVAAAGGPRRGRHRDLEGPLAAGHPGDRDVPPLPRVRDRAPRSTTRCSPASGRGRRSPSGRRSSRRPGTRSATAARRSPTITRSAATTPAGCPGRSPPAAWRC